MLKKIIPLLFLSLLVYGGFYAINSTSAQSVATTCEPYVVRSGDTLSRIARRYADVSLSELMTANDLRLTSIIRIGQTLCIPQPVALESDGCLDYTVRSGDTIARIAGRYDDVSISELLTANGLRLSSIIRIGDTLCIPLGESAPAPQPTATVIQRQPVEPDQSSTSTPFASTNGDACLTHTVRYGDSLSRIASGYDVSLSDLMQTNSLRLTSIIQIGDELCVPQQRLPLPIELNILTSTPAPSSPTVVPTTPPTSAPTATPVQTSVPTSGTVTGCETYAVRSGDTLSRIARRYDDVSLSDLLDANDLTLTSVIRIGQALCIPVAGAVSQSNPTEGPWPTATNIVAPAATTAATAAPTTAPTSAPNNEPTPRPTSTQFPTNTPTDAPEPTNTSTLEPTVAPTIAPTVAPTAEPTDEPVAAVQPPASSGGLYLSSPDQFTSQSRNPLTGEVVSASNLNRRPILCKISNYPKRYVLPQSGLNSADLVFEHFAEGNITRFSALFYGETPSRVGPVRSARLIDLELPLMYDAALCFSGGSSGQGQNEGVQDKLRDVSFSERVMFPSAPGVYYRSGEDKPLEHTFYARPNDAWTYLSSQGQNRAPNFTSYMTFSEDIPASANASEISIKYGQGDLVQWTYDPAIDKYRRTTNGTRITDALDGAQVTASNVVVLYAPHYIDRNICETQGATQCNSFSTEIQIWGGGFAQFFRNGRQINGTWYRPDRATDGQMFTFEIDSGDQAGQVMPLAIGNTWFQVVPYDEYLTTTITVE